MGKDIARLAGDFLLLQLSLGLGHGQVVALGLVGCQHREQDDGKDGKDHGQQRRPGLGECLIRGRRTCQTDDLRVDGVVAQQRGGGHGAQAGDEGHDGEGEHGGHQGGKYHLEKHLEGLCAHVPGSLHGVVVNAPDGVAQEQGVVTGAGEGHGEQHRPEAGKPVLVHVGEDLHQLAGDDAVAVVQEQIPGDESHAGVDHGGHIAQPENPRALDVKILRQKHDGHAHNVHSDHQAHRKLQGIPHIPAHAAREEEPDDREGVPAAVGAHRGKNTGQGIEAGHQHEAHKEVQIQEKAYGLGDGVPAQADGLLFHWASPSCAGG